MLSRNRLVVRQWQLLQALCSTGGQGASVQQLSLMTHVHSRTVYRDLAALQEAHLPLESVSCWDGVRRWKVLKGSPCPLCNGRL